MCSKQRMTTALCRLCALLASLLAWLLVQSNCRCKRCVCVCRTAMPAGLAQYRAFCPNNTASLVTASGIRLLMRHFKAHFNRRGPRFKDITSVVHSRHLHLPKSRACLSFAGLLRVARRGIHKLQ